jgi:hypothetical protein
MTMEYRFNAEEWVKLAPTERVRRCRLWAGEAQKLADAAVGSIREDYLRIAENWNQLAGDIDRISN